MGQGRGQGMGHGMRFIFVACAALLIWGSTALQPPLWVYPAVFALIFAFYANTIRERVPLYLTNRTTWAVVSQILDGHSSTALERPAFVDLGCGLGGMLAYLARAKPGWDIEGVETAPGPYLIAKLRTALIPNARVRYQSLWKVDLATFDVAYAFLSPAPMPRLHTKVAAEMRPGTLFVSNSFWADNQPFDGEIKVSDTRSTQLIYHKQP